MQPADCVVAVFDTHLAAEAAVNRLAAAGLEVKDLSIVGKGYHTEEKVVGFYNIGDRIKLWGKQGAYWGGLWGLFFGGVFVTVPVLGSIVVLGHLAVALVAALESALAVGGLSVLGAAIYSIGVPKDSVLQYEAAVQADGYLVMTHGRSEDVARAKAILALAGPSRLDLHPSVPASGSVAPPVPVSA